MFNSQKSLPTEKQIGYLSDGMLRQVLRENPELITEFQPDNIKTASVDVRLGTEFLRYKFWPLIKDMRVDQDPYMERLQVRTPELVAPLRDNRGWLNRLQRLWFLVRHKFWFGVDDDGLYFLMRPHGFVNGVIVEWINLPAHIGAILDGKSSTGRRAICVHITAGFADPGYSGKMTTEMYNFAWQWMKLRPGSRIGQLRFFYYRDACENPYGSANQSNHYQGDSTVAAGAELE